MHVDTRPRIPYRLPSGEVVRYAFDADSVDAYYPPRYLDCQIDGRIVYIELVDPPMVLA